MTNRADAGRDCNEEAFGTSFNKVSQKERVVERKRHDDPAIRKGCKTSQGPLPKRLDVAVSGLATVIRVEEWYPKEPARFIGRRLWD